MNMKDYLNLNEAAEYLGMSLVTLRRLVAKGKVVVQPDPLDSRQKLVHRANLDAILTNNGIKPEQATQILELRRKVKDEALLKKRERFIGKTSGGSKPIDPEPQTMLPPNVTKIPATSEQALSESPSDLPTPDTMPTMTQQPEPLPNKFQQAPAAIITQNGDELEVKELPAPKHQESKPDQNTIQTGHSSSRYDTICSQCGKRWPIIAPANCECGTELLPF